MGAVAQNSPYYGSLEDQYFEIRTITCNEEGNIDTGDKIKMIAPEYAAVRDRMLGYLSGTVPRYQNDVGPLLGEFGSHCLQLGKILPGVGKLIEFDGTEHADIDGPLSADVLSIWLTSDDPAKRAQAATYVTAHPAAVEPFEYLTIVTQLLSRGDREQAAFWYFVFEIRSWPWRRSASDPSGYPALYGSVSATLGAEIYQWASSDPARLESLMIRAARFERSAPLYSGRPEHVTESAWVKLIAESRTRLDEAAVGKLFADKAKIEARRRAEGLYVGPWEEPGAPLPDNWK